MKAIVESVESIRLIPENDADRSVLAHINRQIEKKVRTLGYGGASFEGCDTINPTALVVSLFDAPTPDPKPMRPEFHVSSISDSQIKEACDIVEESVVTSAPSIEELKRESVSRVASATFPVSEQVSREVSVNPESFKMEPVDINTIDNSLIRDFVQVGRSFPNVFREAIDGVLGKEASVKILNGLMSARGWAEHLAKTANKKIAREVCRDEARELDTLWKALARGM